MSPVSPSLQNLQKIIIEYMINWFNSLPAHSSLLQSLSRQVRIVYSALPSIASQKAIFTTQCKPGHFLCYMCGPCLRVAHVMNSRIYFRVSLCGRGVDTVHFTTDWVMTKKGCVLCSVEDEYWCIVFLTEEWRRHNKTTMDRAGIGLVLLCFCVGVPRALGQNYGKAGRLKGYTRGALCKPRFLSVRHWSGSLLQFQFPSKPGFIQIWTHNHSFRCWQDQR